MPSKNYKSIRRCGQPTMVTNNSQNCHLFQIHGKATFAHWISGVVKIWLPDANREPMVKGRDVGGGRIRTTLIGSFE